MSQVVEREKPASPQLAHYTAEYQRAIAHAASQPRWVAQARESAIAQFERLGFPTTRLEQWRFTSVAPIAERTFALAPLNGDGTDKADSRQISPLGGGVAHAVCVNGQFSPKLSSLDKLPEGRAALALGGMRRNRVLEP